MGVQGDGSLFLDRGYEPKFEPRGSQVGTKKFVMPFLLFNLLDYSIVMELSWAHELNQC